MFAIKNTWSAKAVSGVATLALLASMFVSVVPAVVSAADACNQEFTYSNNNVSSHNNNVSNVVRTNDSRVTITTHNTNSSGNPDSISVDAKSGYAVVAVRLELENNNTNGWDYQGTNEVSSLNPSGEKIEQYEIVIKKTCTAEEQCEIAGDFWNGSTCEEIAVCEGNETYNEETNTCVAPNPTPEEQCDIDGGFWNGSTCEDVAECGENETYNSETNECDTNDNGGDNEEEEENDNGNGGNNGGNSGGGGGGSKTGGVVWCSATVTTFCAQRPSFMGEVLGASTDMCSPLLTTYMGVGKTNNVGEVAKLQVFLNSNMDAGLTINGIFDEAVKKAVEAFQLKYQADVLTPWLPFGLAEDTATGFVYKTTQRMINNLNCASLNIPMPMLP